MQIGTKVICDFFPDWDTHAEKNLKLGQIYIVRNSHSTGKAPGLKLNSDVSAFIPKMFLELETATGIKVEGSFSADYFSYITI